ncbi:MAG TPA: ribosome biogenesis GTP-binding protein YihA/YsxC [Acidimicrobiales bacterium]|jgi:GTP-binding protein|nr:ribosome biogenesis GTP-binding protein YihA/YsxC [Acidimicrobiales bacterium]
MAATPPLPLRFVMSGTRVEDLPPTRGEVAIVGRSNVGKSSLINSIANRKNLAKVSKTPGRTQLLNLFELPDGTSVMDLPGYGFANAPASVRAKWPEMIDGYLLGRRNLHAVVALIDAEVGPTKNDSQTLAWLRSHGLPVKVVATKHDKVKPSKRDQRRKDLAAGCLLDPKDVLWVSSAKNVNIDELRARITEWLAPVTDWSPPAPTRKERAEARAAEAAAPAPTTGDEYDDEDEWN